MNARKKLKVAAVVLGIGSNFIKTLPIIESEDDDDDEEETQIFEMYQCYHDLRKCRNQVTRIVNYFEVTIPQQNAREFKSHFRMTRETFEALIGILGPFLKNSVGTGRPTNNVEKQLLAILWLLATPDSYRSVGERFNFGKSTLSNTFVRVIKGLNKIASRVIKWPQGEGAVKVINTFATRGLQNVIGAIDGTYVPIKAPKENPDAYVTRKCNYAMTLQGICDSDLNFTDCYIGYPGSVSDNRIFRNSPIFEGIENNHNEYFPNESFIIGDKAYPLKTWCIPPYIERRRLTDNQRNFNIIHAKTRQTIERTFALFFGRFRRLKYLDMNRVDLIPATVIACCVLHNICLQHGDFDREYLREGEVFMLNNVNNDNIELIDAHYRDDIAVNKRDQIAQELAV